MYTPALTVSAPKLNCSSYLHRMSRTNRILSGIKSSTLNVWKINLASQSFLVTPAHVVVFAKAGDSPVWETSPHLNELKNLDWRIPAKYFSFHNGSYDLAYVKCESSLDALDLDVHPVELPEKGTVFFKQPLNEDAKMYIHSPALRTEDVTLYKAPGNSQLLEAYNIGFGGHSGAGVFAVDSSNLLGMFVRRGEPLNAKQSISVDVPSVINRAYLAECLQAFLGLDQIAKDVAEMETKMIKRDDLWEVSTSLNFRRGLFLPASRFEPLIVEEPSVHVKEIEGMKAEIIRI